MPRNIKVAPIDAAIARVLNGEYHRYPGVTRATIAANAGIPEVTVQRLFTGKSSWSTSQFLATVAAIGTTTSPDALFRQAIEMLPEIEAELSEGGATVTEISKGGGYVWQGEEHAINQDKAVAKLAADTIEINPDDHTP
jgi:hypothetical protein